MAPGPALLLVFVTALAAIGRGGFGASAFDVLEIQSDTQHGADAPGDAFIDPLISSRNTGWAGALLRERTGSPLFGVLGNRLNDRG